MKNINATKQNIRKTHGQSTTIETVETVETVELENVTGGCGACGCGRPAADGAFQFGARFPRF